MMIRAVLKCLLFFLLCLSAIPVAAQTRTLYGELDAGARLFRFAIQVAGDGTAELLSLDEGEQKFKLDDFELSPEKLNFKVKLTNAVYESTFDREANVYRGKWKQAGGEFDLPFATVEKIPADPVQEIWEGELNVFGRKMTLRFRIYDREKHPVVFDSPDQRAGGFTGTVEKTSEQVIFKVPGLRGEFKARVSGDPMILSGTWNQGIPLPLELKKITLAEMKKNSEPPKRPQTPKAPFPYDIVEVSVENSSADLTLAGTLTIPQSESDVKFPCAILISGSGPQDRNESLMDHQPFWVLADHLSRNGIACLRFDDRGTAKSTGDHSTATSADFATDVSAIVDFLKEHPRIDAGKIGLCGHSEGGLIAPIVATRRDDVAFVVMLAGPGVNGEKILQNQVGLILKASGAKPEEIEAARFVQSRLIQLSKAEGEVDATTLEKLTEELIARYPDQEKEKDLVRANAQAGLKRLSTPWMKYFLTYEPGPTLAKVKCPVLAINGSKDTQVDPELNFPAIRKAFESAGKQNFEMVLLKDLNHLFQKCETGAIEEYQEIEETFSPDALKLVSDWILKTTR